jgi:hypothetical protein
MTLIRVQNLSQTHSHFGKNDAFFILLSYYTPNFEAKW